MPDVVALDEDIALVISTGYPAGVADVDTEEYTPTFLRSLEAEVAAATESDRVEATRTSYGYGADAIAVAVVLSGLSALFLAGKPIHDNLHAWIKLGRRLGPLVRQLKERLGATRLSESAALAIALHAVADQEPNMRSVVLLSKALSRVPNNSLASEVHHLFRNHPDRYYVFTIEVGRASHVVGIASTGDVLFHHRLSLDWHRFPTIEQR